jgi:hypothetical protein
MVKYRPAQLDRTFAALVDQTRRAILARLERDDRVRRIRARPAVVFHRDLMREHA